MTTAALHPITALLFIEGATCLLQISAVPRNRICLLIYDHDLKDHLMMTGAPFTREKLCVSEILKN
jgi:hypothetical protein